MAAGVLLAALVALTF